jgi:deoxyribonuclease V
MASGQNRPAGVALPFAVRQRKPLFVSVGHQVSLASAVEWTLACTTRYRLPETTWYAHRLASGPELPS